MIEDVKQKVAEFVHHKFPLAGSQQLSHSDSLLKSGVVDSMGILEIVTFLEEEFDIELSDDDVLADNFDSVQSISDLICSKSVGS